MNRLITIGKIARTSGVRGEVIVRNESHWYEPFDDLRSVQVLFKSKQYEFEVESIRDLGDRLAVKFKGIETPEQAEEFRGAELVVPEHSLPKLPEDEHYVFEIEGFEVYDLDGVRIGEVTEILNFPANDVIVVRTTEGEELLVPAVKAVVDRIDTEGKKVILKNIEGIRE